MKKNKEENPVFSKIKELLHECTKTERRKAIFKLALWGIFFISAFLFLKIASLFVKPNPPLKETNLNDYNLITKLNENNYNYNYVVDLNNEKFIYKGTRYNNLEEGYFENNTGVIKYHRENDLFYQITGDYYSPIDSIYNSINPSYLSLSEIAELIKNVELDKKDNYYQYQLINGILVKVYHENDNIKTINISYDTVNYELNYDYQNIKEIKSIEGMITE